MSNLRALHQLARRRGLSVVLDAARAFENSALIRERERGYETRSLASLVAELCSYADACCASLTKDFCVARGAFVGVRDPALATTLTDLAILGCGDGLEASDRSVLGQALQLDHEGPLGAAGRVARTRSLAQALEHLGVPVVAPPATASSWMPLR